MNAPADTPEPPYYAVIFTSLRTEGDHGYGAMTESMDALARAQPGYLGHESARDGPRDGGLGITVSYWRDLDAIAAWKRQLDHIAGQRLGRERWYSAYRVRIARVERAYGFPSPLAREEGPGSGWEGEGSRRVLKGPRRHPRPPTPPCGAGPSLPINGEGS